MSKPVCKGIAEASRKTGIPEVTLRYRMKKMGLSLAAAIAYPGGRHKPSFASRAREAGVNESTARARMRRRGESEEAALSGPPRSKGVVKHKDGGLEGLDSVARQVGVSRQRVWEVMKKYNLPLSGALEYLQECAEKRHKNGAHRGQP